MQQRNQNSNKKKEEEEKEKDDGDHGGDTDDTDSALVQRLEQQLLTNNIVFGPSATESIGHRNVVAHRRTHSNALFSMLDGGEQMRHRPRALSFALQEPPSLHKYYPASHLLQSKHEIESRTIYLSLWLLPPEPILKQLTKEIINLSLQYSSSHGSSAPFIPHVTIIGSIRCRTMRDVHDIGIKLKTGLTKYGGGTNGVPCNFYNSTNNNANNNNSSSKNDRCQAMYYKSDDHQKNKLVWSQSCIAMMERSEEFMGLLQQSRGILLLV